MDRNKAKDYIIEGGYDYAKDLLVQSFGEDTAELLLSGIKESKESKPFAKIKEANVDELFACIKEESTQTIAIILANVETHKASQLLLRFPEELHSEILINMGTLSKISPIILKTIEEDINSKLSSVDKNSDDKMGGVTSLVGILGQVGRRAEKNILTRIQEENSFLAEQIKANMFVFEDISKLDDRTVQRILRDVDIRVLSFALKSASEDISSIIFKNQSKRAAETLKEEIELLGPVQMSEVENAQQEIVNVIRTLEEQGEIKIVRGTSDAFVE
ncbi:MAG: flagellar motor switch protein FliG [Romboutsia sp.]|nr:flagellar motor switch protein FliG [Romboutsia sp.]